MNDRSNFQQLDDKLYRHISTGIDMCLVPAGNFQMGILPEEERLLGEYQDCHEKEFVEGFLEQEKSTMQPVKSVSVSDFLMAVFPLTIKQAAQFGLKTRGEFEEENCPVELTIDEILKLSKEIDLRLPQESEWEYAIRAKEKYIKAIPEETELVFEYDDSKLNSFGLCGLGSFPEVCSDNWRDSYEEPHDTSNNTNKVIRGGAALISPWQACGEWLMLLPFARYSYEKALNDYFCVRLAASIEA